MSLLIVENRVRLTFSTDEIFVIKNNKKLKDSLTVYFSKLQRQR